MKTLEQLGISPAPWRADTDKWGSENDVLCEYTRDLVRKGERRTKVVARCNANFETFKADVRVIAAAPELYEALRMYQEAFEEIRKSAWFLDANFHEIMNLNKVMTAADAALAKAAGESEVEK